MKKVKDINEYLCIYSSQKQAIMNNPANKDKKRDDILSREPEDDEFSSALDSFPMQAALGIYTMNRHTEKTENEDR